MKILLVAPPWLPVPPPAYGGTEAVVETLALGLRAAGHEVVLYATGDSTCDVTTHWVYERALGTENASPPAELHQVVHAYRCARDWDADIVHDHTVAGPLYGLHARVPVVTTNHGPFAEDLGSYYAAIADSVPVVALSRHHASTAPGTPVAAVIHHGVEVDRFPFGDGCGGYAVFLGRLTPDKGVHRAVQIAKAAGVPLRLAGRLREPAEHRYFESCVAPLLGGDIAYVGEVAGDEKRRLLADATCLLNPISWPEPFGMVMIEALACGTPVIATPHGSVPEIVTDGVTGFVRRTDTELAAVLGRIPELDRAECRKDTCRRFSADRLIADHLKLYADVVATSPRA